MMTKPDRFLIGHRLYRQLGPKVCEMWINLLRGMTEPLTGWSIG